MDAVTYLSKAEPFGCFLPSKDSDPCITFCRTAY